MRCIAFPVLTTIMLALLSSANAQAAVYHSVATGPALTEPVACRVVRERIVRPNGSLVYRQKRTCGAGWGPHCQTIREKVRRPNGTVVYRKVKRCR
jgi:hypothetical protein